MKAIFLTFFISCLTISTVAQTNDSLDYPDGDNIIHHLEYSLDYNCDHEQANWVMYSLTENELKFDTERSNDFREDKTVSCTSALLSDYRKSGYDRGHLSPAADNKRSEEVMSESFYMSNMSPQEPGFNRGVWLRLEKQVREWAIEYDSLIIITGPVLTEGLSTIGDNVSVPKYFYKIVYAPIQNKMTAFYIENESSKDDLSSFVFSVDEVEKYTAIDFFPYSGLVELEKRRSFWK